MANGRHRLVFVKRSEQRSPKETAFIKRVESQVVRKAFNDYEELKTNVYASLVRFLEDNGYLHSLPWDPFPTESHQMRLNVMKKQAANANFCEAAEKQHFENSVGQMSKRKSQPIKNQSVDSSKGAGEGSTNSKSR